MGRKRVVAGLAVLALVGVFAGVPSWPRGPQPLRKTFEQVRKGMTYDEVCATVGGPPGDYSGGRCVPGAPFQGGAVPIFQSWTAIDGTLVVYLNHDGRVRAVLIIEPALMPEPSLLERPRQRLGF